MGLYRLYGLTIDSELPLPAPAIEKVPVDITVTWEEERAVPRDLPGGRVLSEIDLGVVNYSTTRTEDGFVIRFPDICDVLVGPSLNTVAVVPASSQRRPLAELLLVGNVLAMILTLRGECVLHASAVAMNGRAVAYVGPPGGGKSTLAALTCAGGGRLITDDVLRLIPGIDGWRCPTGTGMVRLRPQAESIASLLNGPIENTHDQRIGVSLGGEEAEFPVAALVFPVLSRESATVALTPLNEQDALMRLTSFPRTLGWKDPEVLARSFRWNARLAREIPVYDAIVPWGPPFDAAVASELIRQLDSRGPETT